MLQVGHERFLDQAVDADGDLIVEVMMMVEAKPINLDQTMNDLNWLVTMKKELRAIEKNKTWELIEESIKKSINVKWVYKLKQRPNGEISKHKARIVARGFLQKLGIDFDEVYAIVARLETIIIVVLTITYRGCKIHQLNVKSEFVNGPLEEEVYVSKPPGFKIKG